MMHGLAVSTQTHIIKSQDFQQDAICKVIGSERWPIHGLIRYFECELASVVSQALFLAESSNHGLAALCYFGTLLLFSPAKNPDLRPPKLNLKIVSKCHHARSIWLFPQQNDQEQASVRPHFLFSLG